MTEGENQKSRDDDSLAETLEVFRNFIESNETRRPALLRNIGACATWLADNVRGGVDFLFDKFTTPPSFPMRIGTHFETEFSGEIDRADLDSLPYNEDTENS